MLPQEESEDDLDDDAIPLDQLTGFAKSIRLYEMGKYEQVHEVLGTCQEDPDCLNFESELIVCGMGVPRNRTLALEIAKSAAAMGNGDAQYHLGMVRFHMQILFFD